MNQSLPTIRSYGEYHGQNYGLNSLMVSFPNGLTLYYSYETIVAFKGRHGLRIRRNDWSTTTGKHLNWIDGGAKDDRLTGAQFEVLLTSELAHYGLMEQSGSFNECANSQPHEWTEPKEGERDGNKKAETIFWCANCEATLDEDGGIIK